MSCKGEGHAIVVTVGHASGGSSPKAVVEFCNDLTRGEVVLLLAEVVGQYADLFPPTDADVEAVARAMAEWRS